MKNLTEKQRNILEFIAEFSRNEGMSPTVYEIGEHFGIKTSTVFIHLRALQRKNFLFRSSKARSIKLLQTPEIPDGAKDGSASGAFVAVPFFDSPTPEKVSRLNLAGRLIAVSPELISAGKPGRVFAFPVEEDGMRDFGIRSGDVAFASAEESAPKTGDIVLLYADGHSRPGGFFPRPDGGVELRGAAPDVPSRLFAAGTFRILGVMIAIQRKF